MTERVAVLDAAEEVGAVGAAHAAESGAARRLVPPVVAAFEASGLAALVMPGALGGMAASPMLMTEAVEAMARHDASTAWCCSVGLGVNHLASVVPQATARSLFRHPQRGGAGPFGPGAAALPEGDTVHVAGRWSFASNCQQAAVTAAGVIITEDGAPKQTANGIELGLAFLTDDEITVHETWDTVGLRATGSHDITADARVEPARISSLWAEKWPDEPIFRLRTFDVLGPCLAAVPLGIGRAALDALAAKAAADAEGAPRPGPRPRFADNPWAQADFARAEAHLRGARALLLEALADAFGHGERGDPPPRSVTATIGVACAEALHAGKHAVEAAASLMGSTAIREGSPLPMLRRDVDAAGSHIMFSPALASGLARELAGIPTAAFPFLPAPDA